MRRRRKAPLSLLEKLARVLARETQRRFGGGPTPWAQYGRTTQANYRHVARAALRVVGGGIDRQAILALLTKEDERTRPLYVGAHDARTAAVKLSGVIWGLLWQTGPDDPLPPHPTALTSEAEARVLFEAHPRAGETITRGYTAWVLWSIHREITKIDPALLAYVSSDVDGNTPLDAARRLLRPVPAR